MATGVRRSNVVQVVTPVRLWSAYQQMPDSVHSTASGATHGSPRPPQATLIAGSPYAAFCSGPAGTGRCGRPRTRPGRCAMSARQALASALANGREGIATGAVLAGDGVPLGCGARE